MILTVSRRKFTENSTIGDLYVDGSFFCYTLEDKVRKNKIYGETAIPLGEYEVILNYSPTFKKVLPRLLDVPNFSGVLIHNGNHKGHTKGCILLGLTNSEDFIGMSRTALNKLMQKLSGVKKIKLIIENQNFNTGCL